MRPPRSRTGVAVTRLPWTGGMSAQCEVRFIHSLFRRARNGMPVPGVLLGWDEPVGANAMSGPVMAFVELLNRDAP
jgi:hypothetical protein